MISGNTRLFAILADPVAQVRTPQVLNGYFAARGVDAILVPMHVAAENLEEVLGGLRRMKNLGGFIVTYPRDRIKAVLFIFVFVRITFIPAALLIGVWFVSQLFHAGAVAPTQTGGVAYLAHVGGFIFGAVTARWFEGGRPIASQPID